MQRGPTSPVILVASSRSDGNTARLARSVFPTNCESIDLRSLRIGYYAYDDSNASDDFLPLLRKIIDAPLWVLATPLYWYTMSAQAKTFVDRLSDLITIQRELGHRLRDKSLAVVCSGTDPGLPPGLKNPSD